MKRPTIAGPVCAFLLCGIVIEPALADIGWNPPNLDLSAAKVTNFVCPDGRLNPTAVATWFVVQDEHVSGVFHTGKDLAAELGRSTINPADKGGSVASAIQVEVDALFAGLPGATRPSAADFFADRNPATAPACSALGKVKPPPTPDAPAVANLRFRGNTDALLLARDDKVFAAAPAATLSVTNNSTSKTVTSTLQAAIGYALTDQESQLSFIPMASVDRNMSETNGKPAKSDRENVTAGIAATWSPTFLLFGHSSQNVASITPLHIWNDINNSQINYIHIFDHLQMNGGINSMFGGEFKWGPLLDYREDFGFYTDRGLPPAARHDFHQVGGDFGLAFSVPDINTTLTVTQIAMAQTESGRKDINLFNAALVYNFPGTFLGVDKPFGVKASYENGILEDTAQRAQEWDISLSAKF